MTWKARRRQLKKIIKSKRLFNYLRYTDLGCERNATLVTDVLFPNRFAMWRIAETTSFIRDQAADVMVFRQDSFANVQYSVDYEQMMSEQGYADYNILIFDPRYNDLNRFNTRVDGTKYNNKFNASYLITRHQKFDIKRYKLVYHIFLMCYSQFNEAVLYPKRRQAVHLYPGGGYVDRSSLGALDRRSRVISTHPRTSGDLRAVGHREFIELYGGTFLKKGEVPIPQKPINDGVLTVGFASMGHSAEKGTRHYVRLAKLYKEKYPNSRVEFISIGQSALDPAIIHHAPMAMQDLLTFYRQQVDIMVTMDTGIAYNGWPLGSEAALSGAVLATTDPHGARDKYNLAPDTIFCFDLDNLQRLADFIVSLDQDRSYLQKRSSALQSEITAMLSYENQQVKIFGYLGL